MPRTINFPDGSQETFDDNTPDRDIMVEGTKRTFGQRVKELGAPTALAMMLGSLGETLRMAEQEQSTLPTTLDAGSVMGMTPEQVQNTAALIQRDRMFQQQQKADRRQSVVEQMEAEKDRQQEIKLMQQRAKNNKALADYQDQLAETRAKRKEQRGELVGTPGTGMYNVGFRDGEPFADELLPPPEDDSVPTVRSFADNTTRQWNPTTKSWDTLATRPDAVGGAGGAGGSAVNFQLKTDENGYMWSWDPRANTMTPVVGPDGEHMRAKDPTRPDNLAQDARDMGTLINALYTIPQIKAMGIDVPIDMAIQMLGTPDGHGGIVREDRQRLGQKLLESGYQPDEVREALDRNGFFDDRSWWPGRVGTQWNPPTSAATTAPTAGATKPSSGDSNKPRRGTYKGETGYLINGMFYTDEEMERLQEE